MKENTSCYLCKNNELEKLEGTVRDNPALDILRCKKCSLVFLSSFSHVCEGFYENDGMHKGNICIESWRKSTYEDDLRRFNMLKKQIKDKKVLDFGCGNGGFLSLAQKSAAKTCGVEIQKSMKNFYLQNNICAFENIDEVEDKFDFITVFHVLEHIKDPIELLKRLSEKLDEQGQIIIEVPNSEDALLSLYKNKGFMNFTYWSCHLFLFNKKTILNLVKQSGLKVNYLKHTQRYGVANHIWWILKNQPAGHKKLPFLNNKYINKIYELILAKFNVTDTIIVSISK